MNIMYALPKDIVCIIDRYTFDYLYHKVMLEYNDKWLDNLTRWSDAHCIFMRNIYAFANWRNCYWVHNWVAGSRQIYNFFRINRTTPTGASTPTGALLSMNY